MKQFIKWYLKRMTKEQRALRITFIGARLNVKRVKWLYFNNHPYEVLKEDEK